MRPEGAADPADSLWALMPLLRAACWVDPTHAFDEAIPHCASFDPARRTTLYHYDAGIGTKGHGFLAEEWRLPGQWGTYVDPPAHFVRGLRFQDEIPVPEASRRPRPPLPLRPERAGGTRPDSW